MNLMQDIIQTKLMGSGRSGPITPESIVSATGQMTEQQAADTLNNLGGISAVLTETTYSALKALRDNGGLKSGMQYRITDYVCTVANDSEARAVSHPFDIIVTAYDENTLNENARACLHSGDNYYSAQGAMANLSAWELKYCIDNDTDRFAWADATNGKGVVFWLKDDWNNEFPYDFKQIQFKRYKITACAKAPGLIGTYLASSNANSAITKDSTDYIWCYTFTSYDADNESVYDSSVAVGLNEDDHYCIANSNVCKEIITAGNTPKAKLLNNVFLSTIDEDGHVSAPPYANTFGSGCCFNTLGEDAHSNTFGNDCGFNTIGEFCSFNTFGDDCIYSVFDIDCSMNTFGNGCTGNTFGSGFETNRIGNNCNTNSFGNNCRLFVFGNGCDNNTFGNFCMNNTFGNGCTHNTFATASGGATAQSYFCNNTFEDGVRYVILYQSTTGPNACVQNYRALNGLQGTSSNKINIEANTGLSYCTFIGKNTDGTVKTYNVMDTTPTEITVSGATPSIAASANYVYKCGELTSLTVSSFPASGKFWIWFTSGSTATTVTGIDNFTPEANKTYKITVENGYATFDSWTVGGGS